MASPVLLVADDLATIAAVRRLVGKEGYELILATSAADALIAFGHHLPGVVLLDPRVESERGGVVLEELQSHPDGALARVLLLGESVPGFALPVIPLPPESSTFLPMLDEAMRGGGASAADNWKVGGEPAPSPQPHGGPPTPEPEAWRATAPQPPGMTPAAGVDPAFAPVPDSHQGIASPFEDAPHPDAGAPPHHESQGAPPLERAIALAAAAKLQAREQALAREAASRELAQSAQRLQEEKDLERAENHKSLALVEKLRAELADEKGRGGEARVAAERAHYLGLLADKDREIENLARDLEAAQDEAMQRGQEGEKKLDELKKMARAMEGEIERVKKERDLARSELGKGADLAVKLAAADEAAQKAEETLRQERERAQTALGRTLDENSGLQRMVAQLEAALAEQTKRHDDEVQRRGEVENTLATTLKHAEELETRAFELESRWNEGTEDLGRASEENVRLLEQVKALTAQRDGLYQERKELTAHRDQLAAQRDQLIDERGGLVADAGAARSDREQLVFERDGYREERDKFLAERDQLRAEKNGLLAERDSLSAVRDRLSSERERLVPELQKVNADRDQLAAEATRLSQLNAELAGESARLTAELAALKANATSSAQAAEEVKAAVAREVEALRDEVRRLEARAIAAEAHANALEEKLALPVKVAGRAALMVPRAATVDRERLSELVCNLVVGRNEVKLELGTPDGLRTLWLSRGMLVAAESTGAGESLIERARKDGLIDARQEAELRMLRPASGKEVLDVLRSRGFLRAAETAPLVQRYVEQVALDGLSEGNVGYRVSEEAIGPEVLSLEAPRPLLPLLAEALRRGLAPEALLELLGGGEAVPVSRESSLDLRTLGFTEKERRLLGYVDGQATVEELSMVAGVKPDAAFRALLVARYLGLVEVRAPAPGQAVMDPELDVKRLVAKFEEVQEADYFTILGLGRSAGTDEVQRSFERLAREFDPIRFSGHPDARLQQQAQVVFRLLEEAARALEDDRRRTEYARHLLD